MEPGADLEALRIHRPPSPRRRSSGWFGRTVGALLLLGCGVALWTFRQPLIAALERRSLPPVVRIHRVERPREHVGAVRGMAANGHVVAARRAALSADTPGRIVELFVEEGSRVDKGALVARLYADEYAAAVKRARAQEAIEKAALERAGAAVEAAAAEVARLEAALVAAGAAHRGDEAELALALIENERVSQMARHRAVDLRARDRARADLERARARAEQSEAQIAGARGALAHGRAQHAIAKAEEAGSAGRVAEAAAAVEQARATLQKTEVRAPFSGIVVLKDAEVGEVVSPNVTGGASSRGSIVTIVAIDSLEVQAEVPETSLGAVRIGGAARVFLDADPENPYEGVVDRIWPTANRQKATIEVRIEFEQRDDRLRPDMGVRVVFLPEGAAPAAPPPAGPRTPQIPEDCVARRDPAPGVFVLEDGRARFREIVVGPARDGRVPVERGLAGGETLVIAPPAALEDGDPVAVDEEARGR